MTKQYFKLERCPRDQTTKRCMLANSLASTSATVLQCTHQSCIFKTRGGGKKRKKKRERGGGKLECKDINRLSFRLADVPITRAKVTTNRGSSLQRERLGSSSDISDGLSWL